MFESPSDLRNVFERAVDPTILHDVSANETNAWLDAMNTETANVPHFDHEHLISNATDEALPTERYLGKAEIVKEINDIGMLMVQARDAAISGDPQQYGLAA